jgi:DNA-binding transcriptional LysR family regulator
VVGALPATFPDVMDVPLCPYRLLLCAAPAYLDSKGKPEHPTDLTEHDCITSVLMGNHWVFEQPPSSVSVEVRSKLHANDTRVLRDAALRGIGVAVLPEFLVQEDFRSGALVELLPETPIPSFWLKASVPRMKLAKPGVNELIEYLKMRMHPQPPWEAAAQPSQPPDA